VYGWRTTHPAGAIVVVSPDDEINNKTDAANWAGRVVE